jgi:SAM-dependent methyltransferase
MTWDERYDTDDFVYGTEPNDFLAQVADRLTPGELLSIAEGEGRNAVFLAGLGHRVTGVDSSAVGLAKARRLAARRGVALTTEVCDLAGFDPGQARWQTVVSIFCHLPSALRSALYTRLVAALKPGGLLVLEAYTPDQLQHGTGGPKDPDMLPTLAALQHELAGLDFLIARETVRPVIEGRFHSGMGAVVQVLARRPLE